MAQRFAGSDNRVGENGWPRSPSCALHLVVLAQEALGKGESLSDPDGICGEENWFTRESTVMVRQGHGNGTGKVEIGVTDMGGWLQVRPGAGAYDDDLPTYLASALSEWLRANPQARLASVVPIVRDGRTVELHAWYV